MHIDLSAKSALVTGGGAGIGRGIALALAEAGADVAVTYRTHDGQTVATEIKERGRSAAAFELDATDSAAVDTVVDRAAEALQGKIDILINNAGGMIDRRPVADMPDDHWHQVLNVNLSSAFYCTRRALAHMPTGGRVVNISSLAGRHGGGRGATAYGAAKAGMHGLTRALAKELGERGITVNAVAPGLILDTPFHSTHTPETEQQATIASLPVGRAGYPDDVATAVLYLVSGAGAFCSGTVLDLNGAAYFS